MSASVQSTESSASSVRPGRLFVVAGPSGVGKGTVVRRLRELAPGLVLSVSCTTRDPRPGEVDGQDYRFISPAQFDRLVDDGAFLEWARIFGDHRSGTPAGPVVEGLARGRDVILEIDVQGADQVRSKRPDAVLVFLAPPSEEELARRLRERRTETEEQLARRLGRAREETARVDAFDHVVVNDDVDRAAREIAAIIAGEHGDEAPPPP